MTKGRRARVGAKTVSGRRAAKARDSSAPPTEPRDAEAAERARIRHDQLRVAGEIAVGVAHDLKNYLAALGLRLRVLEADPTCVRAQATNLAAMKKILAESMEVAGRLQAFGQNSSPTPIPSALDAIVHGAVAVAGSAVRMRAHQRGALVLIDCRLPRLPQVLAVADQLRNALVHLLVDTSAAMFAGGTIVIRARPRRAGRGEVLLTVTSQPTKASKAAGYPVFEADDVGVGGATLEQSIAAAGGQVHDTKRGVGDGDFEVSLRTASPVRASPSP